MSSPVGRSHRTAAVTIAHRRSGTRNSALPRSRTLAEMPLCNLSKRAWSIVCCVHGLCAWVVCERETDRQRDRETERECACSEDRSLARSLVLAAWLMYGWLGGWLVAGSELLRLADFSVSAIRVRPSVCPALAPSVPLLLRAATTVACWTSANFRW